MSKKNTFKSNATAIESAAKLEADKLAEAKKTLDADKQKRREAFISEVEMVRQKHGGIFAIQPAPTPGAETPPIVYNILNAISLQIVLDVS